MSGRLAATETDYPAATPRNLYRRCQERLAYDFTAKVPLAFRPCRIQSGHRRNRVAGFPPTARQSSRVPGTAGWTNLDSRLLTRCPRLSGHALYTMMAWSGWRVWSAPASVDRSPRPAPVVLSTLPNAEWSKLFFGQHRPDLALADLVVLEAYVLGYIAAARKVDRAASQAFIPYAWVAFAGLLNAE